MKMNKKGFTLIEMLVVIAIIAVLVAIIIPTVSSATTKAGAAANAANLRAVYAELQTDKLSGVANTEGYVVVEADGTIRLATSADAGASVPPVSKKTAGDAGNVAMSISGDTVVYGTHDIAYYAGVAETGKSS